MKRRQKIKIFRTAVIRENLVSLHVVATFFLIAVGTTLLVGCSNRQNIKSYELSNDKAPVVQVKHFPYIFSMHPEYKNETESLLKLGIRDKHDRFVHGAIASAYLQSQDGHSSKVSFSEDPLIEKYVAVFALKHHEDYVIHTDIEMPDSPRSLFRPQFLFHCCDPIPEAMIRTLPTEESKVK